MFENEIKKRYEIDQKICVFCRFRRELQLENLNEPNVFMTPLQRVEDKTKASAAWAKVMASAKGLSIRPNEMVAV